MKIKNFLIILKVIIVVSIYSCDTNKLSTKEDYLINGTWTPSKTETFYYYDDIFESSEVSTSLSTSKINFKESNVVYYEDPDLIEIIQGTWRIDSTEKYLITDIRLSSSSSTGYGTRYFFYPKSEIIEINLNNLIVESTPEFYFFMNATSKIKVMSYRRRTYVKK